MRAGGGVTDEKIMIKVGLGKVIAAAPVLYTVSLQSYSFFCTEILELDCQPITTQIILKKEKEIHKSGICSFFVRALQY